ncbi:RICIN domain-containing protein [Streptomyces sp. NPDC091376]|uniref:RICIN domain-containing protein n=1 Tax=Streptomyces sp. NPDC091376 TaxID=3365994 RepID=UPI00382FD005
MKLYGRRFARVLTAVGLLVGALVVQSSPAAAANPVAHIHNAQTGLCIDANHAGAVYMSSCDGGNQHQRWERVQLGKSSDGYHVNLFRNVATRDCLQLETTRQDVWATPCFASNGQPFNDGKWRAEGTSYNRFEATWAHGFSTCLDSNSTGDIYIKQCNEGNYQKWHASF